MATVSAAHCGEGTRSLGFIVGRSPNLSSSHFSLELGDSDLVQANIRSCTGEYQEVGKT